MIYIYVSWKEIIIDQHNLNKQFLLLSRVLNLGVYWAVLSLDCDFIAVPCSAPAPEAEEGNPRYRSQCFGNEISGDVRDTDHRNYKLHPVPELQEQGYPGVSERQTAGIAP